MRRFAEEIRTQGYVLLPGYIDAGLLPALGAEFEALTESEAAIIDRTQSGNGTQVRALRSQLEETKRYPVLDKVISDPNIQTTVHEYFRSFYGDVMPPLSLHKQLEIEINRHVGVTNNSIWHFDRVPSLKCAIYIDAVDSDSGAMDVIPRTHAVTRRVALESLKVNADPLFIDNYYDDVESPEVATIVAPAGSIALFDTFCVHRGGRVSGPRVRRTIRLITWPPSMDRRYFDLSVEKERSLAGARRYHPFDRTGQQSKDPSLLFQDL
jgi:Phytanoyl-CoA dioxygenase (PhyH)